MAPAERGSRPVEPLFPPVTGGLRGLTPELVAHRQRARLEAAMVEAVARHGYAGTTLRELVKIAGVSKSTFYEHFESKQAAFLATSDEIVAQVAERVEAAYERPGDHRERLRTALAELMGLVAEEPRAMALTTIETLALGKAGIEHRERGLRIVEAIVSQSFERSPSSIEPPATTVRAVAAGIRGVVYRHLRAGDPEQLPGLADVLTDWALSYQRPDGDLVRKAAAAAGEPAGLPGAEGATGKDAGLSWDEPPDSPRSRAKLTQRERIVRAIGQLVVENGYETLSIPAISATAGTSNQTFYEHFDSKREAFLAAFDASATEGLAATARAFEAAGRGPEAIGAALRAMLEHIAGNELFARLTFFELPTAGPPALDRADAAIEEFTAFLGPGLAQAGSAGKASPTARQAVASGAWSVIQHELVQGRADSLPGLAPELARIILTPLAT